MRTGSMGCGGSRSAAIEPRYYESRDTESTWLTSTDAETQKTGNGGGESEHENTAAAASGQREEKAVTAIRSSSVREKKLVNAGTQCSRNACAPRKPEVKSKSKKTLHTEGVRGVRPAVNTEGIP